MINGTAAGQRSFAVGESAFARNLQTIALGRKVIADAPYSMAFGRQLKVDSSATNSIIIGYGEPDVILNDIPNSIMMGMNSTEPTLFIQDGGGLNHWGRVGIGTTAPQGILHVRDENGSNSDLVIDRNGTAQANLLFNSGGTAPIARIGVNGTGANHLHYDLFQSGGSHIFYVNSSDEAMRIIGNTANVAIGSQTASGRLHVNHPDANTDVVIQRNGSNAARLRFHTGATAAGNLSLTSANDLLMQGLTSNRHLLFNVTMGGTDTEAMRVDGTTSWVGIGTTTPYGRLNVRNDVEFNPNNSQNGSNSLVLYGGVSNATDKHFGAIVWQNFTSRKKAAISSVMGTADDDEVGIAFWTRTDSDVAPVERMRVNFNGNVGIGTISPANRLSVQGSLAVGNSTYANITAPANGAIIQGNVGIGTTTPSGRLHVNGTVFANLSTTSSPTGLNSVMIDPTTRELREYTSTINHKTQVADLEFDKQAFFSLRPVQYRWKEAHGGAEDIGLIAEEVQEHMPNMVNYNYRHTYIDETTGEMLLDSMGIPVVDTTQMQPWGVDYRKISIYLMALAKEQDGRLNALESALEQCCHANSPQFRMDSSDPSRHEGKLETGLNVYPNPNDGNFTVNYALPDGVAANLHLITTSGQKMLLSQNIRFSGNEVFNISGPSGIYHLVLEGADGRVLHSSKIVVAR